MSEADRRNKREAISRLLAQAQAYERDAERQVCEGPAMRLRGRALQSRGSAWVMQAEIMEEA